MLQKGRGLPTDGGSTPGRAPSVEGTLEAVPATLAQTRLIRGTWEKLLSAASSRT
jgi:hypothetical protein